MNKQPYYHCVDIEPTDVAVPRIRKAILSLVPKAQQGGIEIFRDSQILFTAYSDRSEEARRRVERLGITVIAADAEPGDPADLC